MERLDLFSPAKPTRRRSAIEAEAQEPRAPRPAVDRPFQDAFQGDLSRPRKAKKARAERKPKERKERPRRDPRQPPEPTCSAREAVFRCLARREHSQKELRDKLKRQGHLPDAIEEALAYALESGYQSDARFAASMVRFKGVRVGERKLRMLLATQKIDKDTQDEALTQAAPEIVRAVDTLRAKFEHKVHDAKTRQKATAFMAGRGFGFGVISQAWKVVFEAKDIEDYLHP